MPQEKLALTDALSAYTAGVAVQAFADKATHPWGTLAVGHSADLVWLDSDPRNLSADASLTSISTVCTWLAGRQTFSTSD
jgi:predicted amidohydrolase YtcJ